MTATLPPLNPRQRTALLRWCAPQRPSGAAPPLDAREWSELVDVATALGVAGYLFLNLRADPAHAGMPADVWSRLSATYYAFAAANAEILAGLGPILEAFDQRGIRVIVLKGAALAELVHGNVAMRPMFDVDLLVAESDVPSAAALLASQGFVPDERYRPAEWYEQELHHLAPFRRGRLTIELHRELLPPWAPLAATTAELWARAEPRAIAGTKAMVLEAHDFLHHVVLHAAHSHQFLRGLRDLHDLDVLQRSLGARLQWETVLARSGGAERAWLAVLGFRERLGLDSAPSEVVAALRRRGRVGRLERVMLGWAAWPLLTYTGGGGLLPAWMRRIAVMLLLERRGWASRLLRFVRLVADARKSDEAARA